MSTGFTGSDTKSLDRKVEREVEFRMNKLSAGIVGSTSASWGKIEIYKVGNNYQLILIKKKDPLNPRKVGVHTNFQEALRVAHDFLRKDMKHLDIFTDDFQPPSEAFRDVKPKMPALYDKGEEYQKKHDDTIPEADRSFKMAAAGRVEDQYMMDQIDRGEQKMNGGIKKYEDQFPMAKMGYESKKEIVMPGNVDEKKWNEAKQAARKSYPGISEDGDKFWKIVQGIYDNMGGKRMGETYASDNSKFDSHVVDPAKLKAEIKKDLGVKDDPSKINNPRPDADPIMGIQSARDHYMKQ